MTKDKIIAAALALFAKNGYEGTSLADIAQVVGIKKPSIYNHFKNKQDIFLTVFNDILGVHVKKIKILIEGIRNQPANEQLYQILTLTFQYYIDYEDHNAFLNRSLIFPPGDLKYQLKSQFLASEEEMSALLREIIQTGMEKGEIKQGNIDDLLSSYYCLIDGIFIQLSYYDSEKLALRIPNMWENFWYGIKNENG